jgi:anti-anti-sigma factor
VTGPQECNEWHFPAPALEIRVEPASSDRILVIRVGGEIDIANAPALTDWFTDVVEATSTAQITIDIADVDFCDAAGVRAFISAYIHAKVRRIDSQVVNPRPHIAWLLDAANATFLLERGS